MATTRVSWPRLETVVLASRDGAALELASTGWQIRRLDHAAAPRAKTCPAEQRLKELPAEPGCYLLRDAEDRILYIGSSKSLRSSRAQLLPDSTS